MLWFTSENIHRGSDYHSTNKRMLSRYIAWFISDNILRWIFSEVKYWPKYYPFKQLGTLFCARVDFNHHATTAPFECKGYLWDICMVSNSSNFSVGTLRHMDTMLYNTKMSRLCPGHTFTDWTPDKPRLRSGIIRGNPYWCVLFRVASVIIRSSTCTSLTVFEHVQNLTTDQTTVAHPY